MKYRQLAIAVSLCALTAQYAIAETKDTSHSYLEIYNTTGENYTYVPKTYTKEEYAERVKALMEVDDRIEYNNFRSNPHLSARMLRGVFDNDIRGIHNNFNDDGSWKEKLKPVVPVEKVRANLPSARHMRFFHELYALAYTYKFGNSGSSDVKVDLQHYHDEATKALIYKAVDWYFSLNIAPEPQYRDTFRYKPNFDTLAPSITVVGSILADEIHEDMKTSELAARVYKHIDEYGGQTIREQPQRRGPNWTGRYNTAMDYVLFTRNPHRMDEYRHYIDESLSFNEIMSTGLHPDWSMFHHGEMFYWGSYGIVYTQNLIQNLGLPWKDTPWEYSKREINFLEDAMLDGARWVYYRGNVDYVSSPKRATTQFYLMEIAASRFIDQLEALAEVGGDKLHRRDELEFLINNMTPAMGEFETYADKQELPGHKYFWLAEYQNHRRNNFSIAVKRNSQRARAPGDSKARLHLGYAGGYTSLLRLGDETRFSRYGWNFLDMPGTTFEQGRVVAGGRAGASRRGLNLYSGAVTDGFYGAGAFEQQIAEYNLNNKPHGPTVRRVVDGKEFDVISLNGAGAVKGNLFFDDGMVALGQNIHNLEQSDKIIARMTDGRKGPEIEPEPGHIWTTLNNILVRGDIVYSIDGQTLKTISPEQQQFNVVEPQQNMWVWHDNVGYIINKVSDAVLNVTLSTTHKPIHPDLLGERTFFRDLVRTPYKSFFMSKTLPMFHLYIDHGQSPQNDKYEYFVVMDKTLDEFKAFVEDQNGISVVKNSKGIQAVQQGDGLYYALFQKPGTVTFDDGKTIGAEKPMMVMARKTETGYDVTASNPIHLGTRREFIPGEKETVGYFYKDGIDVSFGGFSTEKELKSVTFVLPGEPALADGQSITHSI